MTQDNRSPSRELFDALQKHVENYAGEGWLEESAMPVIEAALAERPISGGVCDDYVPDEVDGYLAIDHGPDYFKPAPTASTSDEAHDDRSPSDKRADMLSLLQRAHDQARERGEMVSLSCGYIRLVIDALTPADDLAAKVGELEQKFADADDDRKRLHREKMEMFECVAEAATTLAGVVGALEKARPIVEADYEEAKEHCDADWEGISYEALTAIDEALKLAQPGGVPSASSAVSDAVDDPECTACGGDWHHVPDRKTVRVPAHPHGQGGKGVMGKPTMTLNLSEREMAVVEELAASADLSKTAIIRQALRLYQLVHERLIAGETMHFSGDRERVAMFIGLGLGEPRP